MDAGVVTVPAPKLFTDAARIALIRNSLGLSREQFGSLFDVGVQQVAKWENELIAPNNYQRAIIDAFGVSIDRDVQIRVDLDAVLASCGPTYVLWLLLNRAYGVHSATNDPLAPPQ